jgi:hypothetical protein
MFLVIEEDDFSSCSHTIRKTFSSYFEFPPYFFLYDCLLIGKFELFNFWFFYVLPKELVSFCDDLPSSSMRKKRKKMKKMS